MTNEEIKGQVLINTDQILRGKEQQEAFEKIKQIISQDAVAGPDLSLQYHLATDASYSALGGSVFQSCCTRYRTWHCSMIEISLFRSRHEDGLKLRESQLQGLSESGRSHG